MARLSEKLRLLLASEETNAARNTSVSAVFVLPPGEIGRIASRVLGVIDRVYSDGDLPIISIQKSAARQRYSTNYEFIAKDKTGNADRTYRILLSLASPTPALDLCHEIGHFIDHQGWGVAFASVESPNYFFEEWTRRVIRSGPARDLMTMARSGYADAFLAGGGYIEMQVDEGYIGYLLSPEELWARCYAQYIAVKSNDELLNEQLEGTLLTQRRQIYYPKQWTSYVEPILEVMDSIFRERGWL